MSAHLTVVPPTTRRYIMADNARFAVADIITLTLDTDLDGQCLTLDRSLWINRVPSMSDGSINVPCTPQGAALLREALAMIEGVA